MNCLLGTRSTGSEKPTLSLCGPILTGLNDLGGKHETLPIFCIASEDETRHDYRMSFSDRDDGSVVFYIGECPSKTTITKSENGGVQSVQVLHSEGVLLLCGPAHTTDWRLDRAPGYARALRHEAMTLAVLRLTVNDLFEKNLLALLRSSLFAYSPERLGELRAASVGREKSSPSQRRSPDGSTCGLG